MQGYYTRHPHIVTDTTTNGRCVVAPVSHRPPKPNMPVKSLHKNLEGEVYLGRVTAYLADKKYRVKFQLGDTQLAALHEGAYTPTFKCRQLIIF